MSRLSISIRWNTPEVGDAGGHRPSANFKFPKRKYGKEKSVWRAFQKQWFQQWEWLHYEEDRDVAFCYYCVKAYQAGTLMSGNLEGTFVSTGYSNWKNATVNFKKHDLTKCHREAEFRVVNVSNSYRDDGDSPEKEKSFLSNQDSFIRGMSSIQHRKTESLCVQKVEEVQVVEIIPTTQSLHILFNDGTSHEFCNVWLRDCCQCEQCWDASHGFRQTNSWLPDPTIEALNTWITEEGRLAVLWKDACDVHQSIYEVDWLQDFGKSFSETKLNVVRNTSHRPPITIWQSRTFHQTDFPHLKYEDFMSSDEGLKRWFELFHRFGFVVLKETPSEGDAIRSMANRISYIRKTSFGYISEMKVGPESNLHPAYTGLPIGLHTDLTYREKSPGSLSMHCIEAADPISAGDNAGGQTKLVDGFQVANWIKNSHPTTYHMLTTIPVPYVYKDPTTGVTYTSHWPVIGSDPLHNIHEIHFSNFARQPLRYPGHLILPFYSALKVFTDRLQAPSSQIEFYLVPGDLITINNRRVLHARTGFDSNKVHRYFRTCYMDLDEIFGHYDAILLNESANKSEVITSD